MKKGKIKSGFYKKYEADKKKQPAPDVKEDNVIVINRTDKESTLSTIFYGIAGVFRVVVLILLFVLSSIGLTAIANGDIRTRLIEILSFMS